jgi:hypothetical protein
VAEFLSWSFSEVSPGLNSPLLNQSTKSGPSHQKIYFLQSQLRRAVRTRRTRTGSRRSTGGSTSSVARAGLRLYGKTMLYDGNPFEYWRYYCQTELKPEQRIEAMRALAAFGVQGHPTAATVGGRTK